MNEFVETYVDSFAAWDVLTLYANDPARISSPSEIARMIGRPLSAVEACMRSLTDKGFFRVEREDEDPAYTWCPPSHLQQHVATFVRQTSERRGRLGALSILLRKLGGAAAGQ